MTWKTTRSRRRRAEAGASLVEVLLASLLLLVASVFVLPMFTQSLTSTRSGGRASELSTLTQQTFELINQRPLQHGDWNLTGATCNPDPCVKETNPEHWYWPSSGNDKLGDEEWLDAAGDADFHWRRTLEVRKYSIADISAGTIDATGTSIDFLGHPNLFDNPLDDDDAGAFDVHFLEFRVEIEPDREDELGAGLRQQQITVSHLRAN